jgi:PEP-CTERM motif
MHAIRKLAVLAAGAFAAASSQAAILLIASFSDNFPFGPFRPRERIEIVISLTNTSTNQTITICEGPCIGDAFTYSLGGAASLPNEYSFFFGNRRVEDVFDGQIEGTLNPGATEDFIFGVYDPIGRVAPGRYSFSTTLQIFDATADRLMLDTSTFSGTWQVVLPRAVPEPSSFALLALSLAALVFTRRRKSLRQLIDYPVSVAQTLQPRRRATFRSSQ